MNLVLAILWLLGALGVFVYQYVTGHRVQFRALDVSIGWMLLVLAAYNFVRWYGTRMGRRDQQAMRIIHEARLRQARTRERPIVPDPTFDFTNNPPSPAGPRNATELPPSDN